jgi:hypothetical protein
MTRQRMSSRKVRKYAKELGLPIVSILVRGGEDHNKYLLLEDGTAMIYKKDGTLSKSGFKWNLY